MTNPSVALERRIGQRFAFNLRVSLLDITTSAEGLGFTQDLSSRGAFLFTDMALRQGAEVQLTLRMPGEITLGENMRVRCRGRILRIVKPSDMRWKVAPDESQSAEISRSASQCACKATNISLRRKTIPPTSGGFRPCTTLSSRNGAQPQRRPVHGAQPIRWVVIPAQKRRKTAVARRSTRIL